MKAFSLIILAIGCVAVLFYGNQYWSERTSTPVSNPPSTESHETSKSPDTAETKDVQSLIANWPEDAKAAFKESLKDGEPYKLALVGSTALGKEENGWSIQVKEAIENAFDGKVAVSIFQYDTTSIEFVNGDKIDEVLGFAPQLVLLEPFSLNDNSNRVGSTSNQGSIELFKRKLIEQNEDAVLILQPTHPIDGATYYPKQIEALKEFANTQDITYLDHWSAWPEGSLRDYLGGTQETPNEKGHTLWSQYLIDYFIAD
ncbi:SGNH/GDSL hydrolase family protein [Bacillus sp. BHET2]|uniref:SGNH/GDSL hydrolase family protein n=1 Tax=Bacillus sp. BHET2 TaxID=2583818 RepID=UPI00110D4FF7|nr:SGNH/GDSL hydrolase family protein [Bacillus sp. BHET2]TMU84112.1 SGNH/GDSL hydrolase family protein [Bacillus sp. BHET2]